MEVLDCICNRRSIRKYNNKPVDQKDIKKLIMSAILAPSGKNGQPWRFCVVHNDKNKLNKIAQKSIYYEWIKTADCLLVIFLDKCESYHYVKDVQSIGAAIQNILLTAHSMNLGCCWIGEILAEDIEVKRILNINNEQMELMAVISIGNVDKDILPYKRNEYASFILKEY